MRWPRPPSRPRTPPPLRRRRTLRPQPTRASRQTPTRRSSPPSRTPPSGSEEATPQAIRDLIKSLNDSGVAAVVTDELMADLGLTVIGLPSEHRHHHRRSDSGPEGPAPGSRRRGADAAQRPGGHLRRHEPGAAGDPRLPPALPDGGHQPPLHDVGPQRSRRLRQRPLRPRRRRHRPRLQPTPSGGQHPRQPDRRRARPAGEAGQAVRKPTSSRRSAAGPWMSPPHAHYCPDTPTAA